MDLDFKGGYGVGRVGRALEGDGGDGVADEEQAVLGPVEDKLAEELWRDARRLERLTHEIGHAPSGGDEEDALLGVKGEAGVGRAKPTLEEAANSEREEEGEVLFIPLLWDCGRGGEGGFPDANARCFAVDAVNDKAVYSFKRCIPLTRQ